MVIYIKIQKAISKLDKGFKIRRKAWKNTEYYLYKSEFGEIYYVFSRIRKSYETPYIFEIEDFKEQDWIIV